MVKKIFGALSLVLAAVGVATALTYDDNPGNIAVAVVFTIIGLFLLLKKSKSKEQKAEIKARIQTQKELNNRTFSGEHMAGLPIAAGVMCGFTFNPDGIEISGSGNSFRLGFDKTTDMQIKTDVDIQKSYVSSVGGAVGGAVLFGPLGAMVGGRAKEKTTKTIEYYFIVTYLKENTVEYVSFKISDSLRLSKVLTEYKAFISKSRAVVDL